MYAESYMKHFGSNDIGEKVSHGQNAKILKCIGNESRVVMLKLLNTTEFSFDTRGSKIWLSECALHSRCVKEEFNYK